MFHEANSFSNGNSFSVLTIQGFDRSLPRIFWYGIPAAQMRETL